MENCKAKGDNDMPVITVEAAKLNKEQKAQLAKELTVTASKIMGIPESVFYIHETREIRHRFFSFFM